MMQDAVLIDPTRPAGPSRHLTESLAALNRRFLDLAASQAGQAHADRTLLVPLELAERLATLEAAQRDALARCPYALFDLRFRDEAHWRVALEADAHRVEDRLGGDVDVLEFIGLALFYCWHLATSEPLWAALLLSAGERVVEQLRGATLDRVQASVAPQRGLLTLRWAASRSFWNEAIAAARRPGSARLRRAQLFGLQVAAAARLSA